MCENVHIAHSLTTLVHKERLFPSHFTNPQENVDISGIPLFDAIFGRGITLHSLELPMGPSINYVVSVGGGEGVKSHRYCLAKRQQRRKGVRNRRF